MRSLCIATREKPLLAETRESPCIAMTVLSLGSGQGPGHLLTVETIVWEGLGGRRLPKVRGIHLAGLSEFQGGPRVEARFVSTDIPSAALG